MKLSSLLQQLSLTLPDFYSDVEVKGVDEDSRNIQAGDVFVAVKGKAFDGTQFIEKAVENGAVAVITPEKNGAISDQIPQIIAPNSRELLPLAAKALYPGQPEHVLAVTGTNGKSSVVHFCFQILSELGKHTATLGTLGIETSSGLKLGKAAYTTPPPVWLHKTLNQLHKNEVTHLAMEASSQGMHQHRLDGLEVTVAGFTQLSHDHLDYHGTMEAYLDAKAILFAKLLSKHGVAVINADAKESKLLKEAANQRGIEVKTYGKKANDITIGAIEQKGVNQQVELVVDGTPHEITVPLIGEFQIYNLCCAMGMVMGAGIPFEKIKPILSKISPPKGRMEVVATHISGAPIIIDYAHTPDGLKTVLESLKPVTKGRLIVMFGCGGDRDAKKRPEMGKAAANVADICVVTDDNPRSEDPASIRQQIIAAMPKDKTHEVGDRKEAVNYAIGLLEEGDVLVLAGKGHETGQIVGSTVIDMNDHGLVEANKKLLKP